MEAMRITVDAVVGAVAAFIRKLYPSGVRDLTRRRWPATERFALVRPLTARSRPFSGPTML